MKAGAPAQRARWTSSFGLERGPTWLWGLIASAVAIFIVAIVIFGGTTTPASPSSAKSSPACDRAVSALETFTRNPDHALSVSLGQVAGPNSVTSAAGH